MEAETVIFIDNSQLRISPIDDVEGIVLSPILNI